MYEAYFGISRGPFQLSADPRFFFESERHRKALAHLRKALAQGQPMSAVCGAIGSGKTLLLRRFMQEVVPLPASVAIISSTQLDADDLLAAIAVAFEVPTRESPPADLRDRLTQALRSLKARGIKAVLCVDEAQHLDTDGLRLLESLSTPAEGEPQLLQVFLFGQPELERLLDGVASHDVGGINCRLDALDAAETRAYVEHRLRVVGWTGHPSFEPEAFDEIHRCTDGVPRRINLLCNRSLMALYLRSTSCVDSLLVATSAADIRNEIGDAALPVLVCDVAPYPPEPRWCPPKNKSQSDLGGSASVMGPDTAEPLQGPLLCVAADHGDHVKAAALIRAFQATPGLPPAVLVHTLDEDELARDGMLYGPDRPKQWCIGTSRPLGPATDAPAWSHALNRFEAIVRQHRPAAVVVLDGSDTASDCASIGLAAGVAVVHAGADLRAAAAASDDWPRIRIDRLASLFYTSDEAALRRLQGEGIAADRTQFVGSLLVDALKTSIGLPTAQRQQWPAELVGLPEGPHGMGLVVLDRPVNLADKERLRKLVAVVRQVSRDLALVWPQSAALCSRLAEFRLAREFVGDRIRTCGALAFPVQMELLRNAACVLTDSWDMQDAATAMGIPCVALGNEPHSAIALDAGSTTVVGDNPLLATRAVWDVVYTGGRRGRVPALWDGLAGQRLAAHLANWLLAKSTGAHS